MGRKVDTLPTVTSDRSVAGLFRYGLSLHPPGWNPSSR